MTKHPEGGTLDTISDPSPSSPPTDVRIWATPLFGARASSSNFHCQQKNTARNRGKSYGAG